MRAVIDWARIQYGKYVLSVFAKAETRSDGTRWTLEARLDEVLKRQFHLATLNGQAGCFFGNCILETGGKGPFAAALHHIYRDWMAAATLALSERFCVAEAEVRARQLFAEYQGTILLYKLLGDSSLLVGFRQNSVAALSMTIPMTTVPDTLPRTNPS